uniref:Uncharacterized protein n=1 Tax=Arundo donax TaxID=35708 RepID=A0A0A9CXK4_ARUDO
MKDITYKNWTTLLQNNQPIQAFLAYLYQPHCRHITHEFMSSRN